MTNTPKHGSDVKRQDILEKYKWHIADIFKNDEEWADLCTDIKTVLTEMESFNGHLDSKESIIACLIIKDELSKALEKIYPYARLQRDVDNGNGHNQFLVGTAELLLSDFSNATAFIEPELLALPAKVLEELKNDPDCTQYAHYFDDLLRSAKHVLSARDEEIISRSRLATEGAENVFRIFTGADLVFPSTTDSKGNTVKVSEGSYMLNLTSTDRTLRKNTFESLMGTYHTFRNTLATSLSGKAQASLFFATIHNHKNTMEASLFSDNIPTTLYDGLIATVEENLPALHEYMELKKEILKLDTLHPYDLYVPLTKEGGDTFSFTFEEAVKTVKEALTPLGEEYATALANGLEGGWIDIYENEGKRSGAYSWGVYGVHPYVMLNFQPRYNSVSTLAHEMGHALHSYFSNENQPFATSDYTIFCAEVASTTNEILLLDYMLKKANKEQKIYLLNQYLEAVRTTLYRQTQFAEFEKIIHDEIAKGSSLTADYLEELWHNLNVKYYGKALEVDPLLASEWSRIPHFYTPFYVYKYATGYSAATAFAQSITDKKPGAVEKYLGFLKSGGSDYSLNILKTAGVDLNTPAPVQVTLDKFKEKLAEFKKLIKE